MTTTEISKLLVGYQRRRAIVLKSRNMQANRIQAIIAGTLGYHSGLTKEERAKKFIEAGVEIRAIITGKSNHDLAGIVRTTFIGIDAFNDDLGVLEESMRDLSSSLPVADWVSAPEQRGFGLLQLAQVVGESGDLCKYPAPGKLWRRLGCAPYSFDGQTLMSATWRAGRHGKLPAEEWIKNGYSPRRRSIAYLIGEGLMKQNKSEYRRRYDESKAKITANHPEFKKMRCHRHGMLLATKLLLKNLWIEWNQNERGDLQDETEMPNALLV